MEQEEQLHYRGPVLGGLLRLARLQFLARVEQKSHERGLKGWSTVHYPILQMLYEKPDGVRLTELAEKSAVTKQSMGELVDTLVARGYVERVADPADKRARLVRFTARGEAYAKQSRAAMVAVENDLADLIGRGKLDELKGLLREIIRAG